jgi:hypothetical protein
MQTRTRKLYWGWNTDTIFENEHGVNWRVSTMKRANGRIVSVKQRVIIMAPGMLSPFGTSYKIDHGAVRATQKKVEQLHEEALKAWEVK